MCDGNCDGCCDKNSSEEKLLRLHHGFVEDLKYSDKKILPKGRPRTLVVQNPSNDNTLDNILQDLFEKKSWFIAKDANAYVASEFNVSTEHLRNVDGEDKQFSVYAVQFYHFK